MSRSCCFCMEWIVDWCMFLCAACSRAKQNGSRTSRSSRKCETRRLSLADGHLSSSGTGTTPTTTALTSMTRPANPTSILSRWVLALSNESAAHYRRTSERMTSESARHCAQCRIPLFEAKVRWQGRLISWRFFFFFVKCSFELEFISLNWNFCTARNSNTNMVKLALRIATCYLPFCTLRHSSKTWIK